MNAVQIVRNIADSIGAKPSQAALAWLLGKGDFIVPIPGTKRRKYLEENAGAVDVKLSDDDMARLEAALRPEAVSGRRYNEKLMAWIDRCDLSDRPNQTTGQAHNLKVAGSNPAPATNLCRLDGKLLALRGQHRLTDSEKSLLETQARKYTSPYYSVLRAKIVLTAAQGQPNDQIAASLSVPRHIMNKSPNRSNGNSHALNCASVVAKLQMPSVRALAA